MFQATPRVWFKPVSGSRHSEGFSEIGNLKRLKMEKNILIEDANANQCKKQGLIIDS